MGAHFDDIIVAPRIMTAADFGMGLEAHEPEPGEPQTVRSIGMGPAWADLAVAADLASLAKGRRRHAYRMAADAVDHLIALMDALDAATEDMEPEAGYDLPEGDDERCASSEVDDEPTLGAPEQHPSCYQFALCDTTSSQEHWADGSTRHDEAEVVNEDGTDLDAGELDEADLEPSLGAPEVAFGRHEPFRVDQTHWAGGGLSDLELNDIDKPADLDGLHEQFAGTGLVPALDWTAGGYVG